MPDSASWITIGVDTHQDLHVAVAVDGRGVRLDQLAIPAVMSGYQRLEAWATELGTVVFGTVVFGVEGTSSYGAGLTRFLLERGHRVVEVNRPDRATRYRVGKSDTIDAEMAARSVLAGVATSVPKTGAGTVEMIRVLKIAKDSAVKACTQAINQLKGLLVTAPAPLRESLSGLTIGKLLDRCAALRPGELTSPTAATKHTLRLLARRTQTLRNETKTLETQINQLVTTTAPKLVDLFGVGPNSAATLLITAGDNPQRLHSEAAFAALCAASPVPASSGKTNRHRLNRGGDRHANAALHRIIVVRLRWHPTHPRLPQPTPHRRQNQTRDHPLPQTLPSTRNPHRTPTTHQPHPHHLTIYRSISPHPIPGAAPMPILPAGADSEMQKPRSGGGCG